MPKKKKVATNAENPPSVVKTKEAEKKLLEYYARVGDFIMELRSLDSVTHEQIEQLITKYGI